jgi:hypothetical protein
MACSRRDPMLHSNYQQHSVLPGPSTAQKQYDMPEPQAETRYRSIQVDCRCILLGSRCPKRSREEIRSDRWARSQTVRSRQDRSPRLCLGRGSCQNRGRRFERRAIAIDHLSEQRIVRGGRRGAVIASRYRPPSYWEA